MTAWPEPQLPPDEDRCIYRVLGPLRVAESGEQLSVMSELGMPAMAYIMAMFRNSHDRDKATPALESDTLVGVLLRGGKRLLRENRPGGAALLIDLADVFTTWERDPEGSQVVRDFTDLLVNAVVSGEPVRFMEDHSGGWGVEAGNGSITVRSPESAKHCTEQGDLLNGDQQDEVDLFIGRHKD